MEQRKAQVFRQRLAIGIILGLCLLYLAIAFYFAWFFEPRSYINGVDVSGLSLKAAKEKLFSVQDGYQLTVDGPGGQTQVIPGSSINFVVTDTSNASKCLHSQPKLTWISAIFRDKTYSVDLSGDYDASALETALSDMEMLNESGMTSPEDAYLQEQADGSYAIVPEVIGTTLRFDTAKDLIEEALRETRPQIDLGPAMVLPEIYSDNENLETRMNEWNSYMSAAGLTYQVGDGVEVFDGPAIANLLSDDGEHVTLSYAKTADLMADWASIYDTYKTSFTFTTHSGRTVPIQPYGDYGFLLDEESTCKDVMDKINAHDKGSYEAQYFHKALYNTNKGLGGNYVEISIDAQHLWVWRDGEIVCDTEVVTGLPIYGRITYYGCYAIKRKERNVTLGDIEVEGYETEVSYWVPFNSGEGIHDAPWRENFGGKIWLTLGSHGCVNAPEWIMPDIYDCVDIGEAVVVYGTDYKDDVNNKEIKTVDEEYYYREFYGE